MNPGYGAPKCGRKAKSNKEWQKLVMKYRQSSLGMISEAFGFSSDTSTLSWMIISNSTRKKRQNQWTSGDLGFHEDNAPCHRTMPVAPYMADRGIKLVQNSTSNPDLPLCDIFFLPHMKDSMMGTQTVN